MRRLIFSRPKWSSSRMRRASAMSIGGLGVGCPRQLDQPVEVGAHHRVLACRLGHALEALQLLARRFSTSSGICASAIAFSSSAISARALVAFAELLLDRAHLLAQQVLAVGVADRFARALVDLARDLQHLDAARQELEQLVEPRLQVERLEQRLLLLGADVHQARR